MIRNNFGKAVLNKLFKGSSPILIQTDNYQALLKHISTDQIKKGDAILSFKFKDAENKDVNFEKGYNNIIIYAAFGTTDCLGVTLPIFGLASRRVFKFKNSCYQ